MAPTPSPTPDIIGLELQLQVFISYTITSIGVAYFICRLASSICKKPSDESAPSAESDTADKLDPVKAKGKKIIFWTSFVTICLFFYRSILIWGGMLYHLCGDDNNATDNFAFSISFIGYGLGIWTYTIIIKI